MRLNGILAALMSASALAGCLTAPPAAADPPMYAITVPSCGTGPGSPSVGVPSPLTVLANGNLCTNAAGGGGGNPAAGPTGSPVPSNGDYIAFNLAGNLTGVSASNPLPTSLAGSPYYIATSTGSVYVTGITTTATGFTAPATSTFCFIYAEGANARYRVDGTNPTAAVGVPLNSYDTNGAFLLLTTNLFTPFKAIAQSGTLAFVADCYK